MTSYILKRILLGILTLFIVIVLVYLLVATFKGTPNYRGAVDKKSYDAWIKTNGFDDPAIVRFFRYIKGVLHGDFGAIYDKSSTGYSSVVDQTFKPLKYTMMVMIPSYFIGMIIGIFVGFVAGYNRGNLLDSSIIVVVVVFIAVPSFLVASYALILAPILHLPSTFVDSKVVGNTTKDMIKSLIIPIVVITITNIAGWTYYIRNEVSQILKTDYVLSARSRGFSESIIFRRYVFRNAVYPIAGSIATSFMIVFSSSIIIERVFNVPGTSTVITYAVQNGEINIIMFQVIFFGAINIFLEIFADFVRFMVSPQIMASFKSSISPWTRAKMWNERRKDSQQRSLND